MSKDLVDEKAIGKLKLEHLVHKGHFISGKTYCLLLTSGKEVIRSKGVIRDELTQDDFINLLNGNTVVTLKKTYVKDYSAGSVVIKEITVELSGDSYEKREKLYNCDLWTDTKPLIIDINDNILYTKPSITVKSLKLVLYNIKSLFLTLYRNKTTLLTKYKPKTMGWTYYIPKTMDWIFYPSMYLNLYTKIYMLTFYKKSISMFLTLFITKAIILTVYIIKFMLLTIYIAIIFSLILYIPIILAWTFYKPKTLEWIFYPTMDLTLYTKTYKLTLYKITITKPMLLTLFLTKVITLTIYKTKTIMLTIYKPKTLEWTFYNPKTMDWIFYPSMDLTLYTKTYKLTIYKRTKTKSMVLTLFINKVMILTIRRYEKKALTLRTIVCNSLILRNDNSCIEKSSMWNNILNILWYLFITLLGIFSLIFYFINIGENPEDESIIEDINVNETVIDDDNTEIELSKPISHNSNIVIRTVFSESDSEETESSIQLESKGSESSVSESIGSEPRGLKRKRELDVTEYEDITFDEDEMDLDSHMDKLHFSAKEFENKSIENHVKGNSNNSDAPMHPSNGKWIDENKDLGLSRLF